MTCFSTCCQWLFTKINVLPCDQRQLKYLCISVSNTCLIFFMGNLLSSTFWKKILNQRCNKGDATVWSFSSMENTHTHPHTHKYTTCHPCKISWELQFPSLHPLTEAKTETYTRLIADMMINFSCQKESSRQTVSATIRNVCLLLLHQNVTCFLLSNRFPQMQTWGV